MMKVAMERDVKMKGFAFRREIQRELPIWYHIKSRACRDIFNRSLEVTCLKGGHRVRTVREAEIQGATGPGETAASQAIPPSA
jgi:rRNA maturation endonuclease Nob1